MSEPADLLTNSEKEPKELLEDVERQLLLADERCGQTSFAFLDAIRSLRSAIEYNDDDLLDSHLETMKQCLIDYIEDKIAYSIKKSKVAFSTCEKLVEWVASHGVVSPNQPLDRAGENLQRIVQLQLKGLMNIQRGAASAFDDGTLSGLGPLQNEINRWRELDNSYLKTWPWTSRKRKPVNREMLAEARRARECGEKGIPVSELIDKLKNQ